MSWLLANTAVAVVLCLVVLAAGRWLKPPPAIMHGLWLIVLLKLVTPPLFEVPVDLGWLSRPGPVVDPVVVPVELTALGTVTLPPRAPTPVSPPASTPATSLLLWAWGSGSTLLLAFGVIGAVRARRRQRTFGPVAPALRVEVEGLAGRLGVGVPELRDDPQAVAPYVWSLGRARLLLPARVLLACPAKGRAAVLAHELAHLRRGDHWIARAEVLLALVLWWHPLFWFARSRLRLWAELACDAVAVSAVPDAKLDYATLLVDAASRPESTVPGPAVLASRPAARAAFERRLIMILNDKLPRRVSPIWCVPIITLALGLLAVPVAAQGERETQPVRIEIRINGERVDDLSPAQRRALVEVLFGDRKAAGVDVGRVDRRVDRREPPQEPRASRARDLEGMPSASELQGLIEMGLAEARREIKNDKDLRELGITDDVLQMIDGIAKGEGIESSLDGVVRAAMKGAGKMVMKELENDEDLRKLGITDGIGKLVTGFLQNERNQEMIGDLANQALHSAIKQAKQEIRGDEDLRRLGITDDVENLIDSVIRGGGDFDGSLERLIHKAMKGAMQEIGREVGGSEAENEPEEPRRDRRRTERVRRRIIR